MINLNFASNLNALANQAIPQLKEVWTDPFQSPTIVFPDKKIEQWFRLKWVDKFGTIGNLNATTIDAFLWNLLQPDENQKLLTDEILQSVILAYFLEKAKTLPKPCQTYLQKVGEEPINQVGVKGIDEAKAFDLSQKLSALFRDYELTRPDILDYWKDGEVKEYFGQSEKWQRDIYSAIFHKGSAGISFFQKVFDKINADNGTKLQYMTLPYWFSVKKNYLKDCSGKSFFIFGLSNVGQFYHKMLVELSNVGAKIYAFIQNPCNEYWEDVDCRSSNYNAELDEFGNCPSNENPLLMRFGKSGRENVRVWNNLIDYDVDPIPKKEKYDSVLHSVQSLVLNRKCSLDDVEPVIPRMQKDRSFTITAAPNRIREVEHLHTQICKILENRGNINDVLVLAPNLDDYHSAIVQVFESAGYKKGIPYKILDSKEGNSFTAIALSTLLDICNTGNFNREQLLLLIENPVVQATRGITQIDVENYQGIMNVVPAYRHKEKEDAFTWSRAVKRLLLSKWMDKPFGNIAPFASAETSDERSLIKFITLLDDLENFVRGANKSIVKDEVELDELRDFLFLWLRGSEEAKVLSELRLAFHSIKLIFAAGVNEIPFKMVYHSLKQTVGKARVSSDKLFIDGVSFMKLMPNRIVPAKHLFLMGMGSDQYPGMNEDSSLDLRIVFGRKLGDDNIIDKNKYVFLCQLMSAEESFHISYVNQDLKKATILEPSSVVSELFDFVNRSILKNPLEMKDFRTERKLDEDRDYEDIYTRRGHRNFCISNHIFSSSDTDYTVVQREPKKEEKIVITALQLKKFLENPFEFQVTVSLGLRDEDISVSKDAYEPVKPSYLSQYKIDHQCIEQYLRDEQTDFDFLQCENTGDMPAVPFNEPAKRELQNLIQFQMESLSKIRGQGELNDKPLKISIDLEKGVVLETVIKSFFREGSSITLFDPSIECLKDGIEKMHKHLLMYVQGLMLLASGECESVSSVILFSNASQKGVFKFTPESALQRLRAIYQVAYVEKFRMLLPAKFVLKAVNESDPEKREKMFRQSFEAFTDEDYGEYKSQYFPLFKIFDYGDCGFTSRWIESDLKFGVEKMKDFFCGINLE